MKNSFLVFLLLQVCDTGIGMSPETQEKIFEPYFTTKEKGTGIGLSIVKDIIKKHNGAMCVSSVIKKGSKFRVYLPVSNYS